MGFKEHNNREISKKLAEYITGVELRKYIAEKVKKYLKINNPAVFDGAVGSGQLEQFVNPTILYGVDVQEASINTAKENFKNSEFEVKSFFEYENGDLQVDCVIMNPPFSLKFKDLSEKEQNNIQELFPWKKSGVVDDIFVLKSLNYTKRYGFYILFPGVGYRKTEAQFRKIIGNRLVELNIIENAFVDTNIAVLFIVIDKEKITDEVNREIYDCRVKKILVNDIWKLNENGIWEQLRVFKKEEKGINIEHINNSACENWIKKFKANLELDIFLVKELGANIDVLANIKKVKEICKQGEIEMKTNKKSMDVLNKQLKLLSLFEAVQRM